MSWKVHPSVIAESGMPQGKFPFFSQQHGRCLIIMRVNLLCPIPAARDASHSWGIISENRGIIKTHQDSRYHHNNNSIDFRVPLFQGVGQAGIEHEDC